MAQAVLDLFPGPLGIGRPSIGHDFDLGGMNSRRRTFNRPIWRASRNACARSLPAHPLRYKVVTADEACELFKDQPYKLEIIDGLLRGEFNNEYGGDGRQSASHRGAGHQYLSPRCV